MEFAWTGLPSCAATASESAEIASEQASTHVQRLVVKRRVLITGITYSEATSRGVVYWFVST